MTEEKSVDSLTWVNPERTHGFGVWGNRRIVFGVRVDEKLAEAFTSVAKAKFGSTCIAIEAFMAAVVSSNIASDTRGVNPSITIDIGTIKIERNLRERRKLTKDDVVGEEVEATEDLTKCVYCGKEASDRAVYLQSGKTFAVCCEHLVSVVYQNRDKWKVQGGS